LLYLYHDEKPLEVAGWDYVSLSLVIIFLVICCQPVFGCFYRTARKELMKTLVEILKAPFGTVRFRDFFLADILTSMSVPLTDIGLTVAYFDKDNWKTR
jgi:hypothetical protein